MVDEVVNHVISLRNQHLTTKETNRTLNERWLYPLNSLVTAVSKLPCTIEGTIVEGWEKEVLCSNPRGPSKEATEEAAEDGSLRVQESKTHGERMVTTMVPEVSVEKLEANEKKAWEDSILRQIEALKTGKPDAATDATIAKIQSDRNSNQNQDTQQDN